VTIIVSGATAHLGGLAVEHLLARGIPASDIVAAGRTPKKLASFAESTGVHTAVIDFRRLFPCHDELRLFSQLPGVASAPMADFVAGAVTAVLAKARVQPAVAARVGRRSSARMTT